MARYSNKTAFRRNYGWLSQYVLLLLLLPMKKHDLVFFSGEGNATLGTFEGWIFL
jgi:hypothetical protein